MQLFTKITEFLLNVPPFKVVLQNEGGVFLRGGKYRKTLKPGFYWKLPLYDYIQKICVTQQVVNLPNQSLTAKDGRVLALSGTLKYQIEDVRKALLNVYDYDQSLINLAMSALGEYVSLSNDTSYESICIEVTESIQSDAEEWGIDILDFWLTDFAEHKVYRIMTLDAPTVVIDEQV
jgi:regulator of protease activity HflC (stomatin/prohibitin superfamily)